jgi:hypothetical protein
MNGNGKKVTSGILIVICSFAGIVIGGEVNMPSRSGTKANFIGTNEVERLIGKAAFLKSVSDSEKVHVFLSLGKNAFQLKEPIRCRLVLHNQTGNSIFSAP